jgi:hypothetical protein
VTASAAAPRDFRDDAWLEFAICRGMDPTIFHPDPIGSRRMTPEERQQVDQAQEDRAKRICAQCPVIEPCLEDALLDSPQQDQGYRGMTTPEERREIRRQRGQTVHVTQREQRLTRAAAS